MDETLWELFWTTGLPEAYALAKEAGRVDISERYVGRDGLVFNSVGDGRLPLANIALGAPH